MKFFIDTTKNPHPVVAMSDEEYRVYPEAIKEHLIPVNIENELLETEPEPKTEKGIEE